MPTTAITGAWVPNGTSNQRMRLRAVIDTPTPAAGATTVTVTGTVWVDAGYSFRDSNNTFSHSGSLLGSATMSRNINVQTNGAQAIFTFSKVVALASVPQGQTVGFSLSGIEYVSGTAAVSGTVPIPASSTPPNPSQSPPSAPTGVSVLRKSDAHHVISYSGTSTAQRPISGVRIVRESTTAGGGVRIGDVPWNAPLGTASGGIDDKGTKAGGRYRWAVQLYNGAGASGWVYTGWVKTTPTAPPQSLSLARSGAQVTARWAVTAASNSHWDGQQIRYQYETTTAAWSGWTTLAVATRSTTWTPSDPRVRYQVRGYVSEGGITLYGPPALSAWLTALTPPNRPTPLSPDTTQLVGNTAMTWRHNPIDGTAQSQYQHRWRVDGGAWNDSGAVSSGTSSRTVSLPAGVVGWQVRTRGEHATFSDWSAEATFVVAQRPTVTITAPADGALNTNRLVVGIDYGESSGAPMASWRQALVRDDLTIEEAAGTGAVATIPFKTVLADSTTYTATIWATSGHGLESMPVTRTWTTAFALPQQPALVDAAWVEEQGEVRLGLGLPEPVIQILPDPEGADSKLLEERAAASSGNVVAVHEGPAGLRANLTTDVPNAVLRWGAPGPVEVFPGITYKFTARVSADRYVYQRWAMDQTLDDDTTVTIYGPLEGSAMPYEGTLTWDWTPTRHGYVLPSVEVSGPGPGTMTLRDVRLTFDTSGEAPAWVRIERSLDLGTTWDVIADQLPTYGAATDTRVPLNDTPWYRGVSVSELGVERPGIPVILETPGQVVWLNTGDSAVRITYDMALESEIGHDVVFEDYLSDASQRWPTAHYGPGRTDTASVTGRFVDDIDELGLSVLLGGPVWWRDPTGRSWPAAIDTSGINTSRANRRVGTVSLTARRVSE